MRKLYKVELIIMIIILIFSSFYFLIPAAVIKFALFVWYSRFGCCGVEDGTDFKTSWWTIRELAAPNLTVPLSCCLQGQEKSFLDPDPLNNTLCQDINIDKFRTARHTEGCLKNLDMWMGQHLELVLTACVSFLLYQLLILLITILLCVKRSKKCIKQTKM